MPPGPRFVIRKPTSPLRNPAEPTPKEDRLLVQAVLRGQPEAIQRLVDRLECVPAMARNRNRVLGRPLDPGELDDLVQDCLVILWRKLDRFPEQAPLEGWAYRVCVLEMMNAIRAKRRRPVSSAEAARLAEAPMDAPLHGSEVLTQGLERLGPPAAEIIRRKHFAQLTFEQIAEESDTPVNTVKSHYYRGLQRLRAILRAPAHKETA